MRLVSCMNSVSKRRRGMTFVEVVSALFMIGVASVGILSVAYMARSTARNTEQYTKLRIYATDTIEKLQTNMDAGIDIEGEDYDDNGTTTGVHAEVEVTRLGEEIYGKKTYFVSLRLISRGANCSVTTNAILREGCTAYAD